MPTHPGQVSSTLAAQNTFTDWLLLTGPGGQDFSVTVRGDGAGGGYTGIVTIQAKRQSQDDADAVNIEDLPADLPTIKNGHLIGVWLVRAGFRTGNYTGGNVAIQLSV